VLFIIRIPFIIRELNKKTNPDFIGAGSLQIRFDYGEWLMNTNH